MATFYLLPARTEVARGFSEFLQAWFPDLPISGDHFANDLATIALRQAAAFIIYADELEDDADLAYILPAEFGAEPGDAVVDMRNGPKPMRAPRRLVLRRSTNRRAA